MRAIIFRHWEVDGKPGNSEEYYRNKMKKLIHAMKLALEKKQHGDSAV